MSFFGVIKKIFERSDETAEAVTENLRLGDRAGGDQMTPQEIKALRLALGRTQEGLAKILGATELSVYRWENGKSHPI